MHGTRFLLGTLVMEPNDYVNSPWTIAWSIRMEFSQVLYRYLYRYVLLYKGFRNCIKRWMQRQNCTYRMGRVSGFVSCQEYCPDFIKTWQMIENWGDNIGENIQMTTFALFINNITFKLTKFFHSVNTWFVFISKLFFFFSKIFSISLRVGT